jgi:digeranylgeranylglycerophospholipid reductase
MQKCDVAVIGAGPAGLYAAFRLARAGFEVAVFDAQRRIGEHVVCSGVVGEEAFLRFGLPCRSVLNHIYCFQAISPAGRRLEHRSTAPLARVVDKAAFNQDLGNLARSAGAEMCLGVSVAALNREKHGVTLLARAAEGAVREVKARVAIVASGVNGCLNTGLDLVKPREFLRAMQADIPLGKDGAAHPTELYVGRSVAPAAFGWKIPLGHGRVRLGLMSDRDPRPYFKALARRVAPELDLDQIVPKQKAICQVPVGKSVADRIVAIGEAACHVKTSTGGGIYYGLLSAEMAAEVIARAFGKSDFTVSTLGGFERLWRAAFGIELLAGYLARKTAARFSDSLIEKTFESAQALDLVRRMNGRLKFDWHHQAILASIRSLLAPTTRL